MVFSRDLKEGELVLRKILPQYFSNCGVTTKRTKMHDDISLKVTCLIEKIYNNDICQGKIGKVKPTTTFLGERIPITHTPTTTTAFSKSSIIAFPRNFNKGKISTKEKYNLGHYLKKYKFDDSHLERFIGGNGAKTTE